jgi:probable HAF family extracellular repeat protein
MKLYRSFINSKCMAVTVFTILAISTGMAQAKPANSGSQRYTVINLGNPGGGTYAVAENISRAGFIGGISYLAGDNSVRGVVWMGEEINLGTFKGSNSQTISAPNRFGQDAGFAETSVADPNGEDYCGFGTHLVCIPFIWQYNAKTALPTLGGNNGEAADINSWGQVVGNSETATKDPTCVAPQVLQHLPTVWENGKAKALPTYGGDPDGVAITNNDKGQAAGFSGTCSNGAPTNTAHALFWENGKVTNIGSFGGAINNAAQDINDWGEVVGYSDLSGDTTTHAFLWTKETGIQDLGTLSGDTSSYAIGINNLGQVVGQSCDASGNCRAFLWKNGTMIDLNTLLRPGTSLYLNGAFAINDEGEIVGVAYQATTGNYPAFLAILGPGSCDNETAASSAQVNPRPNVTTPENLRKLVQRRLVSGRLAGGPIEP